MKIKQLLILLLTFASIRSAIAQSDIKRTQYAVYFDSDEHVLTEKEQISLHQFADSLLTFDIKRIYLKGHTDSDADSAYNKALSVKRTDEVQRLLINRGVPKSVFRTASFGEEDPIAINDEDEGKAKNRRVTIQAIYSLKQTATDTVVEIEEPDTCLMDTAIILPQGTILTINKCKYLKKKDCLDFEELFTPESIENANLTTIDSRGNPLVSFGMFRINARPDCKQMCIDTPIVVNIPVPKNKCYEGNPKLYNLNGRNAWQLQRGRSRRVGTVTINGNLFYQFIIENPCSGSTCNLDIKFPDPPKLKVRVNRNYTIDSIVLSDDCPFYRYVMLPDENGRMKKVKDSLPCFVGTGNMRATVSDKSGNSIIIDEEKLNDLAIRRIFSKCGKLKNESRIKNEKGLIRFRKRHLFRKYKIKKYMIKNSS